MGLSRLQVLDVNPELSPSSPRHEGRLNRNILRGIGEDQIERHDHAGANGQAALNVASIHGQIHDPAWPLSLILREIQNALNWRAARCRNVEGGGVHGESLRQ